MPTPLVHDGIMFLYSAGDVVLALDATNGNLLWRYSHSGDDVTSHKFGIALHGNKVLVPTSDLHMVALDARTGAVIWDHAIDVGGNTAINYEAPQLLLRVKLFKVWLLLLCLAEALFLLLI